MITGEDIVCISVMDWDWPFWTSRQHLMARFASQNRVIFVNPPLTFANDYIGACKDARLRRKLFSWAIHGGIVRYGENLLVWTPPPCIPFNRIRDRFLFSRLLELNQRLFRRSLQKALAEAGVREPILWASFNVYFADAVVGRLGEKLSIYHCTDEINGFPGYSPYISEIEARLAARCNLVLSTSEVLMTSKASINPSSYFVPNGADVELFAKAVTWDGREPEDLHAIPPPRAGFVGQIEYRFDCDLLRYTANTLTSWSFVLIGPVQAGNEDIEKLRDLPNVHFLGLKDRWMLPGYLAYLDVALIPYKINRLTQGIYPLKLYEYLAAGRPVVATPIPALKAVDGMIYLGKDGPSFAEAIVRANEEDGPEQALKRSEAALSHSWAHRAEVISEIITTFLDSRSKARDNGRHSLSKQVSLDVMNISVL